MQLDGRLLALMGPIDSLPFVCRYLPTGAMDTSYGDMGRAEISTLDPDANNDPEGLNIRPDNSLLISGSTHNSGIETIWFARLGTDGSLDTTFGLGGSIADTVGPSFGVYVEGLSSISDGGFLASVYKSYAMTWDSLFLIRYQTDGGRDSTFGINGRIDILPQFSSLPYSRIWEPLELPSGSIMLVGGYDAVPEAAAWLLKFTADGTPFPGFGINGQDTIHVCSSSPLQFQQLQMLDDGTLLICGAKECGYNTSLIRADTNGQRVATWADNGELDMDIGGGALGFGPVQYLRRMALTSNHAVVLSGGDGPEGNLGYINLDGTVDSTFDANGATEFNLTPDPAVAKGLVLEPSEVVQDGPCRAYFGLNIQDDSLINIPMIVAVRLCDDIATTAATLHDNGAIDEMRIFPRPAWDQITVVVEKPLERVDWFDALGRPVRVSGSIARETYTAAITGLPAGSYTLLVTALDGDHWIRQAMVIH